MYGLPISTEKKQQLPKKALYAKFDLKTAQRDSFDADISRIDIVAVISSATLPALQVGENVKEMYVLAVQMKHKEYDADNLLLLNKLIPQKMIFALHFEDEVQFVVFHTKLFQTSWQLEQEAILPLSGLTLDSVWDNIVKEIGRIEVRENHSLTEQIAADERQSQLLAKIATLEHKMAKEKQPRRKREYFEQIKKFKSQL